MNEESEPFDLLGEQVVSRPAAGPLAGILDAGARRDQHEPCDPPGVRQRGVQRDAAAHRVAGEREGLRPAATTSLATPSGVSGSASASRPRPASKRPGGSAARHAVPVAGGARKAVEQDDAGVASAGRGSDVADAADTVPSMAAVEGTHQLIAAFVDELARCGVTDACTSPGSRSTPLVLALARHPQLRRTRTSTSVERLLRDRRREGERTTGGARMYLGHRRRQLAPGRDRGRRGACAADRPHRRPPAELREIGAGQTIDQIKLYGGAVRWFFEVGNHEPSDERIAWIRALACRAYAVAADGERPGPVHLNWPLREPLVPPRETAPRARRAPGRAPVDIRAQAGAGAREPARPTSTARPAA